jgi:hypothetical protein
MQIDLTKSDDFTREEIQALLKACGAIKEPEDWNRYLANLMCDFFDREPILTIHQADFGELDEENGKLGVLGGMQTWMDLSIDELTGKFGEIGASWSKFIFPFLKEEPEDYEREEIVSLCKRAKKLLKKLPKNDDRLSYDMAISWLRVKLTEPEMKSIRLRDVARKRRALANPNSSYFFIYGEEQ